MGIEMALFASAAASIGSSLIQGSAASSAASKQADAAKYAADQQREMFGLVNEQQRPYREAGYGALTRIGQLLPGLTAPISAAELRRMPGYQFAINQGTQAARQNMNVGGGGSNVDRAAQKFAIDYTSTTAMPQAIAQRNLSWLDTPGLRNRFTRHFKSHTRTLRITNFAAQQKLLPVISNDIRARRRFAVNAASATFAQGP